MALDPLGECIRFLEYDGHNGCCLSLTRFSLGTALYYAADKGYEESVELLLSHGASQHIPASNGETAMQSAKGKGWGDIVELLLADAIRESS